MGAARRSVFQQNVYSYWATFWLVSLLAGLVVLSCSKDRVPDTLPDTHPARWTDKASSDFHGRVVEQNGAQSCTKCHGADFAGGAAKISCIECHTHQTDHCISCHGGLDATDKSGAPPFGLRGETSDTTLAVGAHTTHVHGSAEAAAVPCVTCHRVPAFVLDSAHFDYPSSGAQVTTDSIAEITWGGLRTKTGTPVWDRSARTCQQTYCHGNFAGGYSENAPVWTGENQAACGSCHDVGSNPASLLWKHDFHVTIAGKQCADCHASVIDTSLHIINAGLHVNGIVDTLTRDTMLCRVCHGDGATGCTACHGGFDNQSGAPPRGLRGETATTSLAVGAHSTHMDGRTQADPFLCQSCHLVPGSITAAGHLGADSIAEITWGDISNGSGGANWDRTTQSCSMTYCHGNFSGGRTSNAPVWTGTDQAACGSCHDVGADPASLLWKHDLHVGTFQLVCADCHFSVVDSLFTITSTALHVNGVVDMLIRDSSRCDACHGSGADQCTLCHGGVDNQTGAPPRGLRGELATTTLAVGAHTRHIEGGSVASARHCDDCHIVPTSLSSPGHFAVDSVAEVTWGNFSDATGGADWNRATAICSNTYCHGNFAGGNVANAPVWTASNQAACGSCHDTGTNPSSLLGLHERHVVEEGFACYRCHSATVNSSMQITGLTRHINGQHDVIFWNGIGSYTDSTNTCSNPGGCHGTRRWQ